jgi:tetratricopeptide (TPR) repeat protein
VKHLRLLSPTRSCNKVIELGPDNAGFYATKAELYTDLKGDIASASRILSNASAFADTAEFNDLYIYIDMMKEKYKTAIHRLMLRSDSFFTISQLKVIPNALLIAIMYTNSGDNEKAKVYFKKSFDIISPLVQQYPDDFRMHATLGIALAGLGDKEKAHQEGQKALELMPVSKDAVVGMNPMEDMALIHTLLGEQDAAIEILEQLLKMPFGWDMTNSNVLYKTYPYWKSLRNNVRFQKMIRQ